MNQRDKGHDLVGRRRAMLQIAGILGASLFLTPSARTLAASLLRRREGSRKLIAVWLDGGPSHLETFDPKPGTTTGGPTKTVGTDVRDWMFNETLPGLASRAENLCVIRSMTSKEGNHSRARQLVKTGYTPNPTVSFPSLGSIVSLELGNQESDLPSYIQILGAGGTNGHLPIDHAPLSISNPEKEIDYLNYAKHVSGDRMDSRERILDVLEDSFRRSGGQQPVAASRSLRRRARRLMETRLRSVFDLEQEKERRRDQYGRTRFGQSCLLARRLVEAGVPAVEVSLSGWDTHEDNFRQTNALNQVLDTGLSALIDDLKQHGLWQDTLIVCMGEFGRTPKITANEGRGHWPRAWSLALAGGCIQTGQVLGHTDELGAEVVERPIQVADLYATIAHTLQIERDREFVVNQRPVTLIDAEGRIIPEVVLS